MNGKTKKILSLSAITLAAGAMVLAGVNGKAFSRLTSGDCDHVGYHYFGSEATHTKEFWACCVCNQQFTSAPASGNWTNKGMITTATEGDLGTIEEGDPRYYAYPAPTGGVSLLNTAKIKLCDQTVPTYTQLADGSTGLYFSADGTKGDFEIRFTFDTTSAQATYKKIHEISFDYMLVGSVSAGIADLEDKASMIQYTGRNADDSKQVYGALEYDVLDATNTWDTVTIGYQTVDSVRAACNPGSEKDIGFILKAHNLNGYIIIKNVNFLIDDVHDFVGSAFVPGRYNSRSRNTVVYDASAGGLRLVNNANGRDDSRAFEMNTNLIAYARSQNVTDIRFDFKADALASEHRSGCGVFVNVSPNVASADGYGWWAPEAPTFAVFGADRIFDGASATYSVSLSDIPVGGSVVLCTGDDNVAEEPLDLFDLIVTKVEVKIGENWVDYSSNCLYTDAIGVGYTGSMNGVDPCSYYNYLPTFDGRSNVLEIPNGTYNFSCSMIGLSTSVAVSSKGYIEIVAKSSASVNFIKSEADLSVNIWQQGSWGDECAGEWKTFVLPAYIFAADGNFSKIYVANISGDPSVSVYVDSITVVDSLF